MGRAKSMYGTTNIEMPELAAAEMAAGTPGSPMRVPARKTILLVTVAIMGMLLLVMLR